MLKSENNLFRYLPFLFLLTAMLYSINVHAGDLKPKKKPKKKIINVSLLAISMNLKELKPDEKFYEVKTTVAEKWKPLMTEVREARISKHEAIDSMNRFTNQLWDFMEVQVKRGKIKKYSDEEWIFPVKGYTANAIGGTNGSGYITAGFDFFDLNSGGHPAHDIFISDGNQDCIDDVTGEPVDILSMSGGIVVETRKNWTPDMTDIKGGNIVYVYDNFTNGFFYYAHLKEVYVNVGDFVKPGTKLGIMGRTGKNAYPSRSPTHLHIMYVRSYDGDLRPENIYKDLIRVKAVE